MWVFLSVCIICATFLFWSERYITPAHSHVKDKAPVQEVDEKNQPVNFDDIIAEIYERLEEEG